MLSLALLLVLMAAAIRATTKKGKLMANTPLRSFRISDEVYNAAKDQAELDGVSVTEVVVQMLKTYGGK